MVIHFIHAWILKDPCFKFNEKNPLALRWVANKRYSLIHVSHVWSCFYWKCVDCIIFGFVTASEAQKKAIKKMVTIAGRLLGIGLPSLKSIYKAARQIILWLMGGLILRPSNFLTNETRNLSNWFWLKLSMRCNDSQSICILCAFCLMLMWCNQISRRGQIYLHYTGLKLLSFALGCCNASLWQLQNLTGTKRRQHFAPV